MPQARLDWEREAAATTAGFCVRASEYASAAAVVLLLLVVVHSPLLPACLSLALSSSLVAAPALELLAPRSRSRRLCESFDYYCSPLS